MIARSRSRAAACVALAALCAGCTLVLPPSRGAEAERALLARHPDAVVLADADDGDGTPTVVPDLDTLAADIGDSLVDLVRAARSSLELDVLRAPASGADANGVLVLDERVEADRPQSSLA